MCVIAAVPKTVRLSDETIQRCWSANSDGAGFSYVADGKVVVLKGFMDLPGFKKAYAEAFDQFGNDSPFVVHFRIRTHGALDEERTHPFYVGKEDSPSALAHNGVLNCVPYTDGELSDTQIFLQKYPRLFDDAAALTSNSKELEDYIGYNKFAVLFPSAEVVVINKALGVEIDGVWYSNTYWNFSGHVGLHYSYTDGAY